MEAATTTETLIPIGGAMEEMATTKLWVVDIRKTLPRHLSRRWKHRKRIRKLVVHMTGSENQDPYKTAEYHISPDNHIAKGGCPGICYHDYVIDTGTIFHCNDYGDSTWHVGLLNSRAVGIVMAYSGQHQNPSEAQLKALIRHLVRLCTFLNLNPQKDILGHREVSGFWTWTGKGSKKYKTSCPGLFLSMDRLRVDVTCSVQRLLSAAGLYEGKIDGDFGKLSKIALKEYQKKKLEAFQQ